VAGALAVLTQAYSSDGNLPVVLSMSDEALRQAGERPIGPVSAAAGIRTLAFYWLCRFEDATESAQQSIDIARRTNDTQYVVYSLPHQGLVLAAQGNFAGAEKLFGEAQRIGREYEIWNFLARAIVFSGGYHYDVFDYDGHESIAAEAAELARSVNFVQTVVSASLDLLFNFIARGDVGRAENILGRVAESVENASGTHRWLWRIRLAQAQAELALARGDWEEALRLAATSISQSQHRGRVKYQMHGEGTRASALAGLGRKREAIAAARQGVDLIRPIGAPALFVRAAAGLLALEGDDTVLAEAREAVGRITVELPSEAMRQRFGAAEAVRLIMKL
jgi:tetratricopeptide (TPR) repeat protein